MIAALDVQYDDTTRTARGGCVVFDDFSSAVATSTYSVLVDNIEPYVPGQFYKREMPVLMALLAVLPVVPSVVIIDGYVSLGPDRPGLGAHLFAALGPGVSFIGVAKTEFVGAAALTIQRHNTKSLYVNSCGMDPGWAAYSIRDMAGPFRIPTLLKQADRIARGLEFAQHEQR